MLDYFGSRCGLDLLYMRQMQNHLKALEADEASNAFSGLNDLCNSETPLAQTLCGLNPHLDSFHKQLGQMCDIIGANLSSASFYLRH